jgi:hypothetical protein
MMTLNYFRDGDCVTAEEFDTLVKPEDMTHP